MAVSFMGFSEAAATFEVSGTMEEGAPVTMAASGKVAACADGNDFCGVALAVRDGLATVQMEGFVRIPYSGAAPAVGYTALAADGSGGVKALSSGRKLLVIEVNSDSTVGLML